MAIDLYYLFASSVAALVARLVTHPIDTVKVRIQTSTQKASIRDVLFDYPFLSLFDGLSVTLWLCVPALSVYLSTYDYVKGLLSTQAGWAFTSPWTHLVSGCMAEVFAGIFFTPMEVIKNKLQSGHDHYPTTFNTGRTHIDSSSNPLLPPMAGNMDGNNNDTTKLIRMIYSKDGWKGFYKGYWISLMVFVPQTMIYFVIYEQLKISMVPGLPAYLLCSILASTISVAICNPLDVVKTRQQVGQENELQRTPATSNNVWTIAYHMYQREGYQSFFKGTLARVIWGVPMTTISMCVFEVLKDWHTK
ncbi:mitochondrial carrier domain-containing protein [Absidia repens]|uniref:Mitochondrial carrier domain-containing protein n=1 Tax=Absidia repens TaxID=90262 RepID=A0A1X2IH91_9FUNG|nr:mitochondrial carrier domain-containing protein [Absidia repens]